MIVCDSSWVISLLFPDEEKPEHIPAVLGNELFAPSLWQLEIANALRSATLRKRFTRAISQQLAQTFDGFEISLVEAPFQSVSAATEFAQIHALSSCDSCYLALAIQRQMPLATRDRALSDAAQRAGITVFN